MKGGTPLMRIFKTSEPVQSDEDRARDARLTAIAERYRVRDVRDEAIEAVDPVETKSTFR